jgi:hypothetical protein
LIENVKEQQDLLKKQVIKHLDSGFMLFCILMADNLA